MALTARTSLSTIALLLLTLVLHVSAASFRVNVGGPTIPSISFYNDYPNYLTSAQNTAVLTVSSPLASKGKFTPVYTTYRYAYAGNLEYKLPVPSGTYKVSLMFAETYTPTQKVGARQFAVLINGVKYRSALDVFKAAGANKPLFISFPNIKASTGFITITLARIPGAENPMLSGFVITGSNPAGIIKPDDSSAPAPNSGSAKCENGILGVMKKTGDKACCPSACGQCGGGGCWKTKPGGKACCIIPILKSKKSCDSNPPPCILNGGVDTGGQTPSPLPPSQAPDDAGSGKCPISGATSNSFRLNAAGGAIPGASMGADNEDYVTSQNKGVLYSMPSVKISAKSGPQPWDEAYVSHRFTWGTVLSYGIPVPNGKYTVKVLFAETYFSEPKQRMFDLFVNGEEKETSLDVFGRVGKNTGLLLSYSGIVPVSGKITVAVFKVAENPMISAIMIEGKGAGNIATGGGCTAPTDGGEGTLNNGFNHRAHAVPGGPYVAMDFSKKGYAQVDLDGTSSHSHFSDPGPPPVSGKIVSYKWSWVVPENGKQVTKTNQNKSGKFSANFPLGKTVVKLEVIDNTGDVAVDSTTVEVKSSTENGAYCYFYDFGSENHNSVPIGETVNSVPKPQYGEPYGTINFNGPGSLAKVKFAANALAIRCVFFIDVQKVGTYSYTIAHNGPFQLYLDGKVLSESASAGQTNTPKKQFSVGLHSFQLHYFRPKSQSPKLILSQGGKVLPPDTVQHDSSTTLPVIEKLSSSTSVPSGGGNIQIYGSGFVNGVSVKFGNVDALNLISSDPGTVQVTVPPGGKGKVFITVSTNAGVSNAFPFSYTAGNTLDQPVVFEKNLLLDKNGNKYKISFAVDVKYGPDGRLYIGTTKGELHAVSVDKNLKAMTSCIRKMSNADSLLGIAFNPASPSLKMYFSVSVLYWKDYNILPFEQGWTNGKIKSIEWSATNLEDSGGKFCAGEMNDVVTGLPVSNHDHGINKLQFTPDGKLLIAIGGFTNGGKSVPGHKPNPPNEPHDALGGVASNPLSAALVTCPANKLTKITYSTYTDPEKAKVVSGKECELYATGFRNSFGMTWHTNGKLYATDNGPNANFGDFTTNCNGGTIPGQNVPDRLYLVAKGKWHGHPNLNRKECPHYVLNPPGAVDPLLSNIQSSTPGIIEYRSNTFGGAMKGTLLLSQFAGQNEGAVGQVVLSASGTLDSWIPNFFWASGVSIAEGPRGEIAAARVYKGEVMFITPKFSKPDVTFMLSVMPRNGPASGGNTVLISGFKFGNNPEATFGSKKCTSVKPIDDESFTCVPPGNSKGALVPVVVKGSTGNSPTYGNDYWYW